jgi:hypothetical protein
LYQKNFQKTESDLTRSCAQRLGGRCWVVSLLITRRSRVRIASSVAERSQPNRARIRTTTGVVLPGVGTFVVTNNNRWITTVAARFGWALDHLLVYGKAGGGWVGNNNLTVTDVTTGVSLRQQQWWLAGGLRRRICVRAQLDGEI